MKNFSEKLQEIILYPEYLLFSNKSFSDIVKAEFIKALKQLNVDHSTFAGEITNYTHIKHNCKLSQIYRAKQERLFLTDYWKDGICMAQAKTRSKRMSMLSVVNWLVNDWSFGEFAGKYPFVKFKKRAFAYEAGRLIEYTWEEYLNSVQKPLGDFVAEAYKTPALSILFPYMSLNRFCFSRCTGYPYSNDCPYVEARAGEITVYSCDGKILGTADTKAAVKLIIENLPPHCTRAINGTKDDYTAMICHKRLRCVGQHEIR